MEWLIGGDTLRLIMGEEQVPLKLLALRAGLGIWAKLSSLNFLVII